MSKYKVHYGQLNGGWITVEASSKQAAINKAARDMREYLPTPDCIELPNGEQEEIES